MASDNPAFLSSPLTENLEALTATAQAATAAHAQQDNASALPELTFAEPKIEGADVLAPLQTSQPLDRTQKPRARKSPGSGAKRTEPSKRKFLCSFSHYGCDTALSSKNEWKRHVHIQHLQLGFYRCDVGACNPDNNPNTPSHKRVYNDFNRKDLFTQHHRRMHKPESGPGSAMTQDPNSADWRAFEDSLEMVRNRCWQEKRKPPARSTCGFCGRVFEGEGSWNERMEHVGGHYSRDLPEACREEREDEDLTNWSLQEGVIKSTPDGRRVLVDQPATSTTNGRASMSGHNNAPPTPTVASGITNTQHVPVTQIDTSMAEAPPISPSNGHSVDNHFLGMDPIRRQSTQRSNYSPINGSGRPGSSSDRLEDLIHTLLNPKKPRMSKRLQWRCDECGLDTCVDFAEDSIEDQRAFATLGKISIICKNSQSPYLKGSRTEQYEIVPCDMLHGRIIENQKQPTNLQATHAEDGHEDHEDQSMESAVVEG